MQSPHGQWSRLLCGECRALTVAWTIFFSGALRCTGGSFGFGRSFSRLAVGAYALLRHTHAFCRACEAHRPY